ncbi:MAG: hypothetical protein R2764_08160 [Bacteroidales bacterium]
MNNRTYRVSEVFVPGGFPKLTYNPREKHKLEEELSEAKDNLCKLVMVTGLTKSGKTVLTKNVFPTEDSVWYDGGSFSTDDEFWIGIAEQLDIFPDETNTEGKEISNQGEANIGGGAQLLLFEVKGGGKVGHSRKKIKTTIRSRKGNPKTLALNDLKAKRKPLIVDDFHYLPREKQGQIVRAIKSLIFDGVPIIFIAIPHRRLDVVKVEREMTSRIKTVKVPEWGHDELKSIPEIGFSLLNISIRPKIIEDFIDQSIGSPHLMQEFCRELCVYLDIKETCSSIKIVDEINLSHLYEKVAANTGKVIFDKLFKGPRQRSDRMKRKLINGIETDIYGLVLFALAELKPNIQTIDYENLRSKIKDVSLDNPPQAHEVSRVLDKMAQIASSDESSTPVIDWEKDERILHITDPFFAFYLRWGIEK